MKICKDYVVENFIGKFLATQWKDNIKTKEQIKDIISKVNNKIIDYKELLEKHNLNKYIDKNNLASSDEESISYPESPQHEQSTDFTSSTDHEKQITFMLNKMLQEGTLSKELKDEDVVFKMTIEKFENLKISFPGCPVQ